MKILKSSGYCTDGCQWNDCDFYTVIEVIQDEVLDGAHVKETMTVCAMFNNLELFRCKSLKICDKVYGLNYEGAP